MSTVRLGIGLAAVLSAASPLAAQDVAVSLRVVEGPLRIAGYYSSRPRYVIPARHYCEPHGPYLYCWDERPYLIERPVVYVYPADPRLVVVERRYRHHRDDDRRWRDDDRRWRRDARKAYKRWRRAHRYPEADVRVVLGWEG